MKFRNRYNPNKLKAKRKYSTGYMEDHLDAVVSQIVRLITPHCVLCGHNVWNDLQCGHFWPRFLRPTRWDLANLVTLCARCNTLHEENPAPYRRWLLTKLKPKGFNELAAKARSHQKFSPLELEAMLEDFETQLSELKKRVA